MDNLTNNQLYSHLLGPIAIFLMLSYVTLLFFIGLSKKFSPLIMIYSLLFLQLEDHSVLRFFYDHHLKMLKQRVYLLL